MDEIRKRALVFLDLDFCFLDFLLRCLVRCLRWLDVCTLWLDPLELLPAQELELEQVLLLEESEESESEPLLGLPPSELDELLDPLEELSEG